MHDQMQITYRTQVWMNMAQEQMGDGLQVDWKYFSLEQSNQPADSTFKLWEQGDTYDHDLNYDKHMRGLLAFWAAEAARQQGNAAFNAFRTALYDARHQDQLDITSRAAIAQVAAQVGLDMAQFERDFNDRQLLDALRRDHEEATTQYAVFGVPTLLFDGNDALFIKMMTVPAVADTLPLLAELRQSFVRPERDWLAEVKRPNPGGLR
jgi:predicted DsbA family dithiol-disulfide isomerase